MSVERQPTFEEVRNNLVAKLYCLAFTLDTQVREGAGAAMLGLPEGTPIMDWPGYEDFNLSKFSFAKELEEVYRYAFHGESAYNVLISDDWENGNLGRLQTLGEIVSSQPIESNMEEVAGLFPEKDAHSNALRQMIDLAKARQNLDFSETVSLRDIALLAGMNERSVRNALYAEEEAMLAASRDASGELVVSQQEALRWLHGRRNFRETVQVGSWDVLPKVLARDEIMPLLNRRLHQWYFVPSETSADIAESVFKRPRLSPEEVECWAYERAAEVVGWTPERVRAVVAQSIDELSPDDCPALSRMLHLDTGWLTAQVMRARFPEAMKELEPVVAQPKSVSSPMNETEGTLDVVLTEAGIRNGYFDIEQRYAKRFFPEDCFGSRGANQHAKTVSLHHDGKGSPYETDLRVKSASIVSPRKRFSAYFTAHSAKAGDVVRFKRTGERSYELTHLPR